MKRCIICAAGYSIKEAIDNGLWSKIEKEEVWSCNYAYKTMSFLPTRQLWVDNKFFRNNAGDLQTLYKKGVICCARKHKQYAFLDGIQQYEVTRDMKCANDKFIYTLSLGLVGGFALSLAVKEKYDEIYLLGMDFGVPKEKIPEKLTHYYQGKLNVESGGMGRPIVYMMPDGRVKKDVESFDYYLPYKDKIFNVSLLSNIYQFTKISYECFYGRIK